jgi:hypothetical protein
MNRLLLGLAFIAVVAVFVHARTVHAHTQPRIEPANWAVAGAPDIQSAEVHTLVGSSFHVIRTGF